MQNCATLQECGMTDSAVYSVALTATIQGPVTRSAPFHVVTPRPVCCGRLMFMFLCLRLKARVEPLRCPSVRLFVCYRTCEQIVLKRMN